MNPTLPGILLSVTVPKDQIILNCQQYISIQEVLPTPRDTKTIVYSELSKRDPCFR